MQLHLRALTLACSFTALTSVAAAQEAYNRTVTEVGVRLVEGPIQDFYELKVGISLRVDEGAPIQAGELDLSASIQVRVDGMLMGEYPWDSNLILANGAQCEPCQGMCGINADNGFQMFCQFPAQSVDDCLCTSDVFLHPDDLFDFHGNSEITVTIATAVGQLPEIYTGDDSYTFPFLAANYCEAEPNSTGAPSVISAQGSASLQLNDLRLSAAPLPANQFGLFFYSEEKTQLPFGDGYRCVGGSIYRLPIVHTGPDGVLALAVDLTMPPAPAGLITAGSSQHFQAWHRDPAANQSGFNFSDGIRITFLP